MARTLQPQGHGPIVDQMDLHVGPESASAYPAQRRRDRVGKPIIERLGMVRCRRPDEARAISLGHVAVERELADHERFAPDILEGTIHLSFLVRKDAKGHALLGQPLGLLQPIAVSHPDEEEDPSADGAYHFPLDLNSCFTNSLEQDPHRGVLTGPTPLGKLMKVLLVDNYDSFTFNLAQAVRAAGAAVDVVVNDELNVAAARFGSYDSVVLSPGPGRADRIRDVGACQGLLAALDPRMPLLGVCLGHQLLALRFGGSIVRAPVVMHGKTSRLVHRGCGPFARVPQGSEVMRYHSWVVDPGRLPRVLEPTAWSDDGTLMALAHRERPWWGLQFHPESIATPYGSRMIRSFLELTSAKRRAGEAHVML